MYFEPISRFRRFRFVIRRNTQEGYTVSYRSSKGTVVTITVVGNRIGGISLSYPSLWKIVEENLVEFVRVNANCSHDRYLRSRNIEQRLHNKQTNAFAFTGIVERKPAFLASMFASRSEINGLTFCAASLFDALVYRLTNRRILDRAFCNVHRSPRVSCLREHESRVNQPHEKLYNRFTPRSR